MRNTFIIFLLLACSSLVLQAKVVDGIAIMVQDKPITLYEIEKVMHDENIDVTKAKDYLIRQKLEKTEIEKRDISVSSDEVFEQIKNMAKQNHMSLMQFYSAMLESRHLTQEQLKEKVKESKLKEKLYRAIAFSNIEQPTPEDEKEYYELHKKRFTHPASFSIIVYQSENQEALMKQMSNPMYYSPDVKSTSQTLEYAKINERLASLLTETEVGHFTKIIPAPRGGFMTFYISDKSDNKTQAFESVRAQIDNMIMDEKRGQVLNDYFERLKLSADIKVLRLPQEG